MELHQLQYTLEVDRRGSFTTAAKALHISQSGVSAQVAKLERELGVDLFDRVGRTTKLTDAGAQLLPLMETALHDIDRISDQADELLGLMRGSVRIGTIIGCMIPGYFDAFAEFRTKHPGVTVTTSESGSDELLAALISGDLDVALLAHSSPLPTSLDVFTIIDEPLVAGVLEGHPWAQGNPLPVTQLATADVITLPSGMGIRAALELACANAGTSLAPAVEAHSPETVLALAARGVGVAVLSESMITEPLVTVPLSSSAHASLSVATPDHPSPASRAFGYPPRQIAGDELMQVHTLKRNSTAFRHAETSD